jgi:hypothetical protein
MQTCIGLAILIAALAERIGCRPLTSAQIVRASPGEVYGAGFLGATGLLLRARESVS